MISPNTKEISPKATPITPHTTKLKYRENAYNSDGTVNYTALTPREIIGELLRRHDTAAIKHRTNLLKRIIDFSGTRRIKTIYNCIPHYRCNLATKQELLKLFNRELSPEYGDSFLSSSESSSSSSSSSDDDSSSSSSSSDDEIQPKRRRREVSGCDIRISIDMPRDQLITLHEEITSLLEATKTYKRGGFYG